MITIINLKELIENNVKCSHEMWDAVLLVAGIDPNTNTTASPSPSHDSCNANSSPHEYARNTSRVGNDFQILEFPNYSHGNHNDSNSCSILNISKDDSSLPSFRPAVLLEKLKTSLYIDLKNNMERLRSKCGDELRTIHGNLTMMSQDVCVALKGIRDDLLGVDDNTHSMNVEPDSVFDYTDTDLATINLNTNPTPKDNPSLNFDLKSDATSILSLTPTSDTSDTRPNIDPNVTPNLNLHFEEAADSEDKSYNTLEDNDRNSYHSILNNGFTNINDTIMKKKVAVHIEENLCLYLKNVIGLGMEFIQKDMLIEAPVYFNIDLLSFYTPASVDIRQMTYLGLLSTASSTFTSATSTSTSSSYPSAKGDSYKSSPSTSFLPLSSSSSSSIFSTVPPPEESTKEPFPVEETSKEPSPIEYSKECSPEEFRKEHSPREPSKESSPSSLSPKSNQNPNPYKTLCTITRINVPDIDIITALKKYHYSSNKLNIEEFNYTLNILDMIEREMMFISSASSNVSNIQLIMERLEKLVLPPSVLSLIKMIGEHISSNIWIEVFDSSGMFIRMYM
jgi:hypothetical protein